MIRPAFDIHDHGRRIVRRAVQREGDLQDEIMRIALGQREWTHSELVALNEELDNCDLTITEWLKRMGVE